jgi:hypothetical protein
VGPIQKMHGQTTEPLILVGADWVGWSTARRDAAFGHSSEAVCRARACSPGRVAQGQKRQRTPNVRNRGLVVPVRDDEEAVQQLEAHRWHREEVEGDDHLTVILVEKRQPSLTRVIVRV